MKVPLLVLALAGAVSQWVEVGGEQVIAKSEADVVAGRERARVAAIQAGESLSSFYVPGYMGINGDGTTEDFKKVSETRHQTTDQATDLVVQVYRVAAIVSGVERVGDPTVAHRFLRVWTNYGDGWKIAVSQLTPIQGEIHGIYVPSGQVVVGPIRPNNPPCHSGVRVALEAEKQLYDVYRTRDFASYATLTAPNFHHVNAAGHILPRRAFLRDVESGDADVLLPWEPAPGSGARQFKACDVTVLICRRANLRTNQPEYQVRVLAVVDKAWRQVATQITTILAPTRP
jgi:hypothetical protein